MKPSPQYIDGLEEHQIFVFGSNLAGIHGAGAARTAQRWFGALPGAGEGPTGWCYAIPTKDERIKTRPLEDIAKSVSVFIVFARDNPTREFLVTEIGCGLAGYEPSQIGPMFTGAPDNVLLPQSFKDAINEKFKME